MAKSGDYDLRKEICDAANIYSTLYDFYVLLNRQPSLHRHSIQAFKLRFWENYSIGFPILLCKGYGADFDGDTMAFYFPVKQFSDNEKERKNISDEMKKMTAINMPYRLGNREIAWSLEQDFVFGHYKSKDNNSLLKSIEDILNKQIPDDEKIEQISEWQKKWIDMANNNSLSLSFFDAGNKNGTFIKEFKNSKCRGKDKQFVQLGEEIEIEGAGLKTNFFTGLNVEDMLSTPDKKVKNINIAARSRKGLMDKKLNVAMAGYFTRKMVSFLYPFRVLEEDCGTKESLIINKELLNELGNNTKNPDKPEEPGKFTLTRLILGRYVKFENDKSDWILIDDSKYKISDFKERIDKGENLLLRSPATCECKLKHGFCAKCSGIDLTRKSIDYNAIHTLGDFIGVDAGHVIGECGTQLSMKTFQTGASFNGTQLSSIFFKRDSDEYFEYLKHLADSKLTGDKESILNTIDVLSIHIEVLFSALKKFEIKSEGEMKSFLKDFDNNGDFTALSFEGTKGILEKKKKVEFELKKEYSPSASYALEKEI